MNIGSTTGSSFLVSASSVVQASEQLYRSARDVADATTTRPVEGAGKTAESMMEVKQGQQSFSANLKTLAAQDEMLGNLVDTQA